MGIDKRKEATSENWFRKFDRTSINGPVVGAAVKECLMMKEGVAFP